MWWFVLGIHLELPHALSLVVISYKKVKEKKYIHTYKQGGQNHAGQGYTSMLIAVPYGVCRGLVIMLVGTNIPAAGAIVLCR